MRRTDEAIRHLTEATQAIWLQCPEEISRVGKGYSARGTGSHGQYFTTLVFAEAESRTLADGLLWGLIEVMSTEIPDIPTLRMMIDKIVTQKAAFFEFLGLSDVGENLMVFVKASADAEDAEELTALVTAAMGYINRVQMWVDVVFPWGVANAFKRVSA